MKLIAQMFLHVSGQHRYRNGASAYLPPILTGGRAGPLI